MHREERERLDGAELALISSRFEAVVRKMTNTLFRTARSGVINSARDFSCCVLTSEDELLAVAESLPIHVLSGPDLIAGWMKRLHPRLAAGDAFLHNSPYHGNSHAGDHCVVAPVVDASGAHRFTVLVKAHVADCGNGTPTSYNPAARDVYEEGALIFPCVRIQQGYEYLEDVLRMCELRIRVPEQWRGDNLAMVGAARVGEAELLSLAAELGWERVTRYVGQWFDYGERTMAAAIEAMPAGRVVAETRHDPFPGVPEGVDLKVAVEVDPEQGTVTVDLRDNPDCVPCGLNLTEATSRTAAMIGVLNSMPAKGPVNAGAFRRLHILIRDGSVAGAARHPASCSLATTGIADRIANAVQRAIADLGAGFGMAEAGLCTPPASGVVSGEDPRYGGRPFLNQLILGMTGGPGGPHTDGWLNLAHVGNAGLMLRDSTEIDELRHPIRIWADGIVEDSEGAGTRRGAPSGRVEFGPVGGAIEVMWASDGNLHPARGARGGEAGSRARQFKRERSGELTELPAAGRVKLVDPETIVSISAAGGGYGPATERDPEAVARDVREGWVSVERAGDVYRVALDDAGVVNRAATNRLRDAEENASKRFEGA